ncbi:MAG: tRNA (adenosine(37)-N6)-threonylcarbamoyltransferase complex ATPase subunit type 1 TsaE [Alphaproteobacteria bacterium]|nr:tRNA (adenosine(37)-N6)-threonylcarbamoyltransferase complex ATPase subunit type 1 TsaE [Alphaproteobacteria bacterium]MDD9919595.1 tRNA (adenosine(37)-N6)-threonylcarbamoyltransferase complex ATPase subunit type 1 TsaE [Alphaproteobacteria bacterium]
MGKFECNLPNEAATVQLAERLADTVQAGDVIRLEGDLGAGKSTFARAFIRAMGTQSQHIPSPTYTIMQVYDDTKLPVAHLDCYRLDDPEELAFLGLEDYLQTGIVMAEWPPAPLQHTEKTAGTLTIQLGIVESGRSANFSVIGTWEDRLPALEIICR